MRDVRRSYQRRGNARIADEKVAIWRPGYSHKGCHCPTVLISDALLMTKYCARTGKREFRTISILIVTVVVIRQAGTTALVIDERCGEKL